MSREQMAWAGGLFVGEGCWGIYAQGTAPYHRAGASLAMNDRDAVQRFADTVGFGTVRVHHQSYGRRDMWRWESKSFQGFQALVAMLWPWLNERRRNDAVRALAIYGHERMNCGQDRAGRWRRPRVLAMTPSAVRQRAWRQERGAEL